MKFFKFIVVCAMIVFINACSASQTSTSRLPSAFALKGTSTAVVGIAIDKKGFPLETIKEVVLKPGQKVVFAGPDRFLISFKNKKSPEKLRYESGNGVVVVVIPKDILQQSEYAEEYRKNGYLRFDYAISINGRELDPPMIIRNDD